MLDSSESGCDDGPHRVWSLWDIMNRFYAVELCRHIESIQVGAARLECQITAQGGGAIVDGPTEEIQSILQDAAEYCEKVGFATAKELININSRQLIDKKKDLSSLVAILKQAGL